MKARRFAAFATFALAAVVLGSHHPARAQTAPTPPAAEPTPTAIASPSPSAAPGTSASAQPSETPTAGAPQPNLAPTETPTQPPIIVDPRAAGVPIGGSQTLRVTQVLGTVIVTVADPTIADVSIDQATRLLTIVGKKIGSTVVTVRDDRGLTRDVAVRVAYPAGTISDAATIRITGRPASAAFLRSSAIDAALGHTTSRAGASAVATPEDVTVNTSLPIDDITTIDVPITIPGGDSYFTVQGTTRVRVENFAQPAIRPASLLVSDFPETLKENGILFTAELTAKASERFLYYHYNPATQPERRIVLKVANPSAEPALVQLISGNAGPGLNEMEVGHLATQRFLVRVAQNEGTVVSVPPGSTISLMAQGLPPKTTVSGLMQIHEIDGAPLHLTLVAQNATDPIDGPIPTSALLVGDRPHARGIYPIPEFFFDYAYDTEGPELEIPIGQIPLPNLVVGQTLAGDYGVLQSVTVRIVNNDRHNARDIALYASPRGGRATGTFVIDRVLVQAHAMAPYGHYKLRQYTIAPGSFVRTEIVTMPEGGSSYPLRLIVAPDDGSPAPGSPDSPIY